LKESPSHQSQLVETYREMADIQDDPRDKICSLTKLTQLQKDSPSHQSQLVETYREMADIQDDPLEELHCLMAGQNVDTACQYTDYNERIGLLHYTIGSKHPDEHKSDKGYHFQKALARLVQNKSESSSKKLYNSKYRGPHHEAVADMRRTIKDLSDGCCIS
jgi:hypothetical protein